MKKKGHRLLLRVQSAVPAAERRMTRKDFVDALYHLDQLRAARLDIHRLELERILLAAAAAAEEDRDER